MDQKEDFKGVCYHYTSLNTFFKMLDGINDNHLIFHASSIFTQNDTSEFVYGFNKLWKFLPKIESDLKITDDHLRLSTLWDNNDSITEEKWNQLFCETFRDSLYKPFVISLSKERDFLPMWETYADSGKGIALGLYLQNFKYPIETENGTKLIDLTKNVYALDMSYGDFSIKDTMIKYIKNILYPNYLEKAKAKTNQQELKKLQVDTLFLISLSASAMLKHDGFKYENEARYFKTCTNASDIKFKESGKRLTPYIDVPIPLSDLKEIVIGPCCDKELTEEIIAIKMAHLGLKTTISKSDIPYKSNKQYFF